MTLSFRAVFRWLPIILVLTLSACGLVAGCGRSDLLADSLTFDGGVTDSGPTGKCGPTSCPSGCCDVNGTCRTGTDVQECGDLGAACTDCLSEGFDTCDSQTRACEKSTTSCDNTTCPFGCCVPSPSGDTICADGTAATECGASGAECQDCTQFNDTCDPGTRNCVAPGCSAANCGGCCIGNTCINNPSDQECGSGGAACQDCFSTGQTCGQTGGLLGCVGTPNCSAANCKGCCIGDVCVGGSDNTACGVGGGECANCTGKSEVCTGGTCVAGATCGPANCPGCCSGNSCVLTTTDQACGKGGAMCAPCPPNDTCNAGTCVPQPTCGPATCATGCCQAGVCAIGTQNTVCGDNGVTCVNCSATGLTCQAQSCQKPVCGPGNCAGCCSAGVCVLGTQDTVCGTAGAACTDCTQTGDVCNGGACKVPCGPTNCATGCCSGQSCVGGFLDTRCGSNGAACTDCTQTGATCDTADTPRVCTAPNSCPSKYTTCAAGVTTPVLTTHQNVCATTDLSDAPEACGSGPNSAACVAYIQFLQANSPTCATCLAPFLFDFNAGDDTAVFNCLSPFVNTSCNHATGCVTDCIDKSCASCAPADVANCDNNVENGTGQCTTFFNNLNCIDMPISQPPGDACDPFSPTYDNGDYGEFLQGMGQLFCQP